MNSNDLGFQIQDNGFCNFCNEYLLTKQKNASRKYDLQELVNKIKLDGKGKKYNCIIGVSGGLDSSYVLHLAYENNLRPLCVHLDNGWNSDLAVSNIKNLLTTFKFDLYTHVISWEEVKKTQLAFISANVVDIEMLMDNAMLSINYTMAKKYNIKFILSGSNTNTEGFKMPANWSHNKFDKRNIRDIVSKYDKNFKFKTHPLISTFEHLIYENILKIKWIKTLDYISYDKEMAKELLVSKYGYRPYPYKHYENVFTRFYQGYILPNKFKYDKRRPHLSPLIIDKKMSRNEALEILNTEPYEDEKLLSMDYDFVLKKLGLTKEYFDKYLNKRISSHFDYKSDQPFWKPIIRFKKKLIK